MNKFVIPVAVAVAVLTVGGLFYVKGNPLQKTSDVAKKGISDKSNARDISDSMMIKGKALKCEFKSEEDNGVATGVVYTDGKKKVYSEVTANYNGQSVKIYSLMDGDWLYTWRSDSNKGTKANLNEIKDDETNDYMAESDFISEEDPSSALENDDKYTCSKWKVNSKLFKVPSDIEFTSIEEMMDNYKDMFKVQDTDYTEKDILKDLDAEKLCDTLPTDKKAECLENLKDVMGN